MRHFSVDTTRLRWLERELKSLAEDRMPKAARGTLNGMAARTRVLWRREAKESMILRAPTRSKPWALTSIRYDKARGTHMDSMRATTGSEAEFMAQQEAGGERVSTGKHGLPIPTGYASGQDGARPSTRKVRDDFRRRNIDLRGKAGKRFAVIKTRKGSVGLFHIKPASKKTKRRLKMVYDLSHRLSPFPATPCSSGPSSASNETLRGFRLRQWRFRFGRGGRGRGLGCSSSKRDAQLPAPERRSWFLRM